MEMQLNRIIVLFFFYTSVLMSQIVSEKEENLKFSQIDFFDKKYEKAIYSLIIDESNRRIKGLYRGMIRISCLI